MRTALAARIDWDDLLLQRTLPELASEWGALIPAGVLDRLARLLCRALQQVKAFTARRNAASPPDRQMP